ncbi:MAG: Glyoxalase/bleomycin resistance protein/dioxygenase [Acidimicrobiales bacterium]|nr:Glyoxalase/bleomycin resistance protein/dioxygenase [Acidimicrobiales bacterium]
MIKGFSHIQLVVSDLDVSLPWYATVLGMEPLTRGTFSGGDYAALRSSSGRFVVGLQTGPVAVEPGSLIEHVSFAVEDLADLHRHRDAIVAAGIDSSELIEEAASWNFRFLDPDGLWVELTASK